MEHIKNIGNTEETLLTLSNIYFSYGDINALNGVNLSIKKGDFTALIGANGSGKTTLFKIIDGIIKPKSGEITFDGKHYDYSMKGLNELRKNIGIVFQNPDIQIFNAVVYDDIAYGLDNRLYREEEARDIILDISRKLNIENLLDRPVGDLSFGQKKKVALAGILVTKPKLVILDEPTAGLDPKGCLDFIELILKLREEENITFLVSTHDLNFAVEYFNDFALMYEGRITERSDAKTVFSSQDFSKSNLIKPSLILLSEKLFKNINFVSINDAYSFLKK